MKINRRPVTVTFCLCLFGSAGSFVQAAINDVDIDAQSGTDASGSASGDYGDVFFCLPCNNPETGTQATWSLSYGVKVTGAAIKGFTHTLTPTVNHNGNGNLTAKVSSKHGVNLPPRKMTRKNSLAHGTMWDNQTATLTPTNAGLGNYTSNWDHSAKKLAFNTTGPGGANAAILAEYDAVGGILALATSGPLTIGSESELFAGSYDVEFDVVINLVDDKIDGIASSAINVTAANGFELFNGEIDFISDTPAGDPLGEVFGELGSDTVFGSIADTLGLTLEITPRSFDNTDVNSIALDALTLGFEGPLDLREGPAIAGDAILFGAQFSVPEPSSLSLAMIGLGVCCWRRNCVNS